jgi:acetyltransferase
MIRRPRAQELIAGMTVDRIFGPMVLFGAGGTAVEVLRDTAQGLPPLDRNLALALMQETRVWRLLQGYRDRPPAAIDAIADVLVRLSYLVARHAEIRELDINPLLADDQGVLALDARVRVADEKSEPRVAMAIRPYPSEWVKDIEIESVGTVRLRPIRPDDEALYQAFFEKVSEEDRRMRFFSTHPDLSHRFLARLTQIDYAREMAFAAIDRSTGQLLGVVRLVADSDYEKAEYGILVRSDVKGRGLGWALMQHLIAYARSEGMGELFGFVLATNTSMLEMCSKLGFSIATDAEDPTLRKVVLDLRRGGAPA